MRHRRNLLDGWDHRRSTPGRNRINARSVVEMPAKMCKMQDNEARSQSNRRWLVPLLHPTSSCPLRWRLQFSFRSPFARNTVNFFGTLPRTTSTGSSSGSPIAWNRGRLSTTRRSDSGRAGPRRVRSICYGRTHLPTCHRQYTLHEHRPSQPPRRDRLHVDCPGVAVDSGQQGAKSLMLRHAFEI